MGAVEEQQEQEEEQEEEAEEGHVRGQDRQNAEEEGLEEDGLPIADGLAGSAPASKTLKWWIILIIVAAIVVVIASLVITGIKCYIIKKKQDDACRLIGNEDATPQQYQTFN